jgi:hypothetical protein
MKERRNGEFWAVMLPRFQAQYGKSRPGEPKKKWARISPGPFVAQMSEILVYFLPLDPNPPSRRLLRASSSATSTGVVSTG